MESKRKNVYIVIFVITTIIAACAAVYFKVDGDKKINEVEVKLEEQNVNKNNTQSNANIESKNTENKTIEKVVEKYKFYPDLDSSKCINPQGDEKFEKRVSYEFTPLSCVVKSDNKTAALTTNWEYATKNWGFIPNGGNGIYEQRKVDNFSGEIVDVIATSWGHTSDYVTLIFLMKDGTLEYIPVYNAYKTNNFKSYGKVEGVSDIAYIGTANVSGLCMPIAMKADGTFYQLATILEKTGNYNF